MKLETILGSAFAGLLLGAGLAKHAAAAPPEPYVPSSNAPITGPRSALTLGNESVSVTAYGLISVGVATVSNVGGARYTTLLSGPQQPPRFGTRAFFDLGEGMSGIAVLEGGYSIANGTLGQGGRMFGRQAFVGLQGEQWGAVTLGRQYDEIPNYLWWANSGNAFATFGDHIGDNDKVEVLYQAVVDRVIADPATGAITGIHYITYDDIGVPAAGGATGTGTVEGTTYVLAANAIENAKILLNSPWKDGITVANTSDQVGRNLMDHPTYLAWGLLPAGTQAYGYRGPLSTSGIETLRNGDFRRDRASWRIEIGNEGWNWPTGDPYTSGLDFVYGSNFGGLNRGATKVQSNAMYVNTLNDYLTREFRIAYLVEQEADPNNRVQLSPTHKDNLGIPRPMLTYNLSDYVKKGFRQARIATTEYMRRLGAEEFTSPNSAAFGITPKHHGTHFTFEGQDYNYAGAGHICGTHVMGLLAANSVVNSYQRSWDHSNLYIVGCGSMPSVGSENPTLTMVALADRTVDDIAPPTPRRRSVDIGKKQ